MKRSIIMLTLAALVSGCDNYDNRYDSGYSDGYAPGYNTACKIRATLIERNWDSKGYSAGYSAGESDGGEQCRLDRIAFVANVPVLANIARYQGLEFIR